MTGPSADGHSETGETVSSLRAELRDDARTQVLAVLAFLIGTVVTIVLTRASLWDTMGSDLLVWLRGAGEDVQVASTPFAVLCWQGSFGLTVGGLLAVETVCYEARTALVPAADGSPRWLRGRSTLAALVALPVGTLVGYQVVAPAVVTTLAAAGTALSAVGWLSIVAAASLLTGVVAQALVVAVAVGVGQS